MSFRGVPIHRDDEESARLLIWRRAVGHVALRHPQSILARTSLRTPHCRLRQLTESTRSRLFWLSMSSGAGRRETIMENIYPCCAGLDVHKESVEACVRRMGPNGRLDQQTRHWGTMTRDLLAMSDWMAAHGRTRRAMAPQTPYP